MIKNLRELNNKLRVLDLASLSFLIKCALVELISRIHADAPCTGPCPLEGTIDLINNQGLDDEIYMDEFTNHTIF